MFSTIQIQPDFILYMGLRLMAACILGGIIGFQREFPEHRPAGLRTHILVCLGAALVMVTSEYMRVIYGDSFDPARIGAQVVSGIGFLGAGAIIKEGANVTGLTTAASLWAVACVGLACGTGFFIGAVLATILIYIVLTILKSVKTKFEEHIAKHLLTIETAVGSNLLDELSELLIKNNLTLKNIVMTKDASDMKQLIKCTLADENGKAPSKEALICEIKSIKGVTKVYM